MCKRYSPAPRLLLRSRVPLLIGAVVSMLLGGCAGKLRRDYPGANPDNVWKAMQGAAEHPVYTDWNVTENGVWADKEGLRIEIFRELKREVREPGLKPRREEQDWALSLRLVQRGSGPAVEVESRTIESAGRFRVATDHIFNEIELRLAQFPSSAEAAAAASTGSSTTSTDKPAPLEAP